jgi:hypothetical protein
MSFKITDEQRDLYVIESLKDDYRFIRKQMLSNIKTIDRSEADAQNYYVDCENLGYIEGVLQYYMNIHDYNKFIGIVNLELDVKPETL